MSKQLTLISKLKNFILDNYCDNNGECDYCGEAGMCPVKEAEDLLADEYGEDYE